LRDPTFSRFDTIPACDTRTHRQTHDDGYYPRRATARVDGDVARNPSYRAGKRKGAI